MTRQIRLRRGREFDLIERFARQAGAHDDVLVGIGDDCAVLRDGMVVSVDTSIEDIHFNRAWLDPADIGYRAAAVALSDLAAMAASPTAMLVSVALQTHDYGEFAAALLAGVANCAHEFGAVIAGGDTSRTAGPLSLSITAIGQAAAPVLRSGARPGDSVWVTGRLGAAAGAVQAWHAGGQPEAAMRQAFVRPSPRIAHALWLRERAALRAMIDLSDGIAADAGHIAAASDLAIELRSDWIPVAPRASLDLALSGGDDYELCFTADAAALANIQNTFGEAFGIELTCVGRVRAGQGITVVNAAGDAIDFRRGYDHFMESAL